MINQLISETSMMDIVVQIQKDKPAKPKGVKHLNYIHWVIENHNEFYQRVLSVIDILGSKTIEKGHSKHLDAAKTRAFGLIGL